MEEARRGVLGLAAAALLAWLLPGLLAWGPARPGPWPVIESRGAAAVGGEPVYHWTTPARGLRGPGTAAPTRSPVPGWRGLLMGQALDLNAATAADLEALPGIGPRTAAAILADRAAAGPYRAVAELARVRGIGPATVRRLEPLVRVDEPAR